MRSLMQCIHAVHACADIETFPGNTLSALSGIIRCNVATFDEFDLRKRKLTHHELPIGLLLEKDLPVVNSYIHEHPYINLLYPNRARPYQFQRDVEISAQKQLPSIKQSPRGKAVMISDLLTTRQFQRLALYNEFYRNYDIEYQILLQVFSDRTVSTCITFNRDKKDFSEQERHLLNLIGPHIAQAYDSARTISALRQVVTNNKKIMPLEKTASSLTSRESEILYWVARGKTNADVAAILNISSGTVRIHLEHIYHKLGVENRTAASIMAVEKLKIRIC